MNTPILAPPLSEPLPSAFKKRRVLLIDTSSTMRGLRAETMRKLGVEVDCAADISEARVWWRADVYNLVLINIENELGCRDKFCEDLRNAIPPQQLAFLVGKPEYLANSPDTSGAFAGPNSIDEALLGDVKVALSADVSGVLRQRWGILEASRRISAVRSLSHARSQAIRERPAPPRDSEIRPAKRPTETRTLDDLLRKEIQ